MPRHRSLSLSLRFPGEITLTSPSPSHFLSFWTAQCTGGWYRRLGFPTTRRPDRVGPGVSGGLPVHSKLWSRSVGRVHPLVRTFPISLHFCLEDLGSRGPSRIDTLSFVCPVWDPGETRCSPFRVPRLGSPSWRTGVSTPPVFAVHGQGGFWSPVSMSGQWFCALSGYPR